MNIKNILSKTLCLFLILMMFFSVTFSSSCSFLFFDLNDVEYEEPDTEELEKILNDSANVIYEYRDLSDSDLTTVSGAAKYKIVTQALLDANDYFSEYVNAIKLAQLYYYKDTSDSYYKEQFNNLYKEYQSFYNAYLKVWYYAVSMPCAAGLWGEDYCKKLQDEYELIGNDTYSSLTSQLSTIQDSYMEYYNAGTTVENKLNVAQLLLDMAQVGNDIAECTGYPSFADFTYKNDFSRTYSPSDSQQLFTYVKQYLSPLSVNVFTKYKNIMIDNPGMASDVQNTVNSLFSSLITVTNETDYEYSMETSDGIMYYNYNNKNVTDLYDDVFTEFTSEISSDFSSSYRTLKSCNLYQTGGKSTSYKGAYTTLLSTYEYPFIYQNYNPSNSTNLITTFVHEFGHFNAFNISSPNTDNYDISEIHSQGSEFLFTPYFKKIGNENFQKYMTIKQIDSTLVDCIIIGCYMDELQQYVFSNYETLTPEDVCTYATNLLSEYKMDSLEGIDLNDFWTKIPHTFNTPFYYISYAASGIPALEIFELSTSDRSKAIDAYNYIVNEEYEFENLITNSGLTSPFEEKTYQNLSEFITEYIA